MEKYYLERHSLFGFVDGEFPRSSFSIYSIEPGEEKTTVCFEATSVRYYQNEDAARDFEKHGFNPCYSGRWISWEDPEYPYCSRHTELFDVELDNDAWRAFGLIV